MNFPVYFIMILICMWCSVDIQHPEMGKIDVVLSSQCMIDNGTVVCRIPPAEAFQPILTNGFARRYHLS